MIHYKDMTFCASPGCKDKCGRILTDDDRARAERMGLPICFAWYCDEHGELLREDDSKAEGKEE